MCKILSTYCMQIICKYFFAKFVQSVSLRHRFFKIVSDLVFYRRKYSGSMPEELVKAQFYTQREGYGHLGKVRKFQQQQE